MNISSDLTSAPYGFDSLVGKPRTVREEGVAKDLFVSIAGEEETKRQDARPGSAAMPGDVSEEDKSKIEMLKIRAEAIATQGEDGLTAGQESELRDIQKQISRISKMPMGENIVTKAKDQAAAKKTEKQAFGDHDGRERDGRGDGRAPDETDRLDMADQPGDRMLRQNALVTTIKTAGTAMGASTFKSRT